MEIANVEAAEAWDGDEGEHWAEHAERYEHSSWRHRARLLQASSIRPDGPRHRHRVRLRDAPRSRRRSSRPTGRRSGSTCPRRCSPRAVQHAADAGVGNVDFVQGDAQVHSLRAETPPTSPSATSGRCSSAIRSPRSPTSPAGSGPGGRLALLAWRELERNDWIMTFRKALALGRELPTPPPDAPTPFSMADPDRVRDPAERRRLPRRRPRAGRRARWRPAIDADHAYAFFSTVGIVNGLLHDVDDAPASRGTREPSHRVQGGRDRRRRPARHLQPG